MKKIKFRKVDYDLLNSRQKENYNFHLVAAKLAEYGFHSMRLSDDYLGADFIALHKDGETLLRVQLKGRFCFDAKYYGKSLHIAFRDGEDVYVYPHDDIRQEMKKQGHVDGSKSEAWISEGSRSWPQLPSKFKPMLTPYRL